MNNFNEAPNWPMVLLLIGIMIIIFSQYGTPWFIIGTILATAGLSVNLGMILTFKEEEEPAE